MIVVPSKQTELTEPTEPADLTNQTNPAVDGRPDQLHQAILPAQHGSLGSLAGLFNLDNLPAKNSTMQMFFDQLQDLEARIPNMQIQFETPVVHQFDASNLSDVKRWFVGCLANMARQQLGRADTNSMVLSINKLRRAFTEDDERAIHLACQANSAESVQDPTNSANQTNPTNLANQTDSVQPNQPNRSNAIQPKVLARLIKYMKLRTQVYIQLVETVIQALLESIEEARQMVVKIRTLEARLHQSISRNADRLVQQAYRQLVGSSFLGLGNMTDQFVSSKPSDLDWPAMLDQLNQPDQPGQPDQGDRQGVQHGCLPDMHARLQRCFARLAKTRQILTACLARNDTKHAELAKQQIRQLSKRARQLQAACMYSTAKSKRNLVVKFDKQKQAKIGQLRNVMARLVKAVQKAQPSHFAEWHFVRDKLDCQKHGLVQLLNWKVNQDVATLRSQLAKQLQVQASQMFDNAISEQRLMDAKIAKYASKLGQPDIAGKLANRYANDTARAARRLVVVLS